MWDCERCGCMAIAASVPACPQCGAAREDDMPKVTVEGGPSHAAAGPAPEPEAAAELPPPPPASAAKAEHVEYATTVLGLPQEEAASLTKPELAELAKSAPPAAGFAPAPKESQE